MNSRSSKPADDQRREGTRIALVRASWHEDIVEQARAGFVEELASAGIDEQHVDVYAVPGSYEIPLLAKRLAKTGRYDAIVAAGLVVDGGIYRHDFVAQAVIQGLMQVQLETEVPIFSVVLTPHHFHAHEEHERYYHKHFRVKGAEAARAVVRTLATHRALTE
jgi:6,7-dimethyl-8-ribityllumazine synthase